MIYNQLVSNEVEEVYANKVIAEIEQSIKPDATVDNILSTIYQKIVLKLGETKELEFELKDSCNKKLAEYKWIRIIEFVEELPKTISGKVRKNVLRCV